MSVPLSSGRDRAAIVAELRRRLPREEGFDREAPVFSFGVPELDSRFPRNGLSFGALHEIAPETEADSPAAFGFMAALAARMAIAGPVLLIASPGLARFGRPHGHGLKHLGVEPGRLILADAEDDMQALWAIEEALRSGAPAAVTGVVGLDLDLKMSRRLHLAAGESGLPFLLLRLGGAAGASAAATRWRIGSAIAGRDRFGLIARQRWRATLERCRNGRTGGWLLELDHACRFGVAAPLADPALSRGAGPDAPSLSVAPGRS